MVVAAITYKTCFYLLLHIFYISIHTALSLPANNQSTDPCPVRSGNVELFRFPNRNKIRAPVSSAGRLRCTLLRRRSMPLPMKNRWCCRALNTYARRAAPVTNDGVCVLCSEDNSMCVCAVENSILGFASSAEPLCFLLSRMATIVMTCITLFSIGLLSILMVRIIRGSQYDSNIIDKLLDS